MEDSEVLVMGKVVVRLGVLMAIDGGSPAAKIKPVSVEVVLIEGIQVIPNSIGNV